MHHSHAKSSSFSSFHMHSTAPLSDTLTSAVQHKTPAPLQRATSLRPSLRKQSSLADFGATVKAKFLRKVVHKDADDELEWGCAGESVDRSPSSTLGPAAPSVSTVARSARLMAAFDAQASPPRRPPPVDMSLSCLTKEEIRDVERKQEEQMARDALASYFARHTLGDKACENKGKDEAVAVKRYDHSRNNSKSSTTSTNATSSSRPLTNDSLPSYSSCAGTPEAEHRVAPPHRRPSLTPAPAYSGPSSDASAKAAPQQPRSYGFI
ncbi:hypothetical protein ACM66B_003786 [Microbotryomycetes sp. NB124-2]